jgi:hypothetical protein
MGAMTARVPAANAFIESSIKDRKGRGHENWHRRTGVVSPRPAMQTRRHQQVVLYLLVPTNVARYSEAQRLDASVHG